MKMTNAPQRRRSFANAVACMDTQRISDSLLMFPQPKRDYLLSQLNEKLLKLANEMGEEWVSKKGKLFTISATVDNIEHVFQAYWIHSENQTLEFRSKISSVWVPTFIFIPKAKPRKKSAPEPQVIVDVPPKTWRHRILVFLAFVGAALGLIVAIASYTNQLSDEICKLLNICAVVSGCASIPLLSTSAIGRDINSSGI